MNVRQLDDEELIDRWKKRRDYNAYQEMKRRYKNMVHKNANKYRATAIPYNNLKLKAFELFDDAINTYKPSKAGFSTHLNYQLRKLDRFAKKHQNIARIPEALALRIGDYDNTVDNLTRQLGRQPTLKEIAKDMKMSQKRVKQLEVSRRGDMFEGKFEAEIDKPSHKLDHILEQVRWELTQQERLIYDHLLGLDGKKQYKSKKKLAKKLGMSQSRLSQITKSIYKKIGPILKDRL